MSGFRLSWLACAGLACLVSASACAYDYCAPHVAGLSAEPLFDEAVLAVNRYREQMPEGASYRLVPLAADERISSRCVPSLSAVRRKSGLLTLDVVCSTGESKPDHYRFRLCQSRLVPVAAHDMKFSDFVGVDDVRMEVRWIPDDQRISVAEVRDIEHGLRLRQILAAGEVLYASMLDRWPDVRRGENVTVSMESAKLRIERPARALRSGSVGESVKVVMSTGERLDAQVSGRGVVTVQAR